jgi:hypothetical protein
MASVAATPAGESGTLIAMLSGTVIGSLLMTYCVRWLTKDTPMEAR